MKEYFDVTFKQLEERAIKMDVITLDEKKEFRKIYKKYDHNTYYVLKYFGIRGDLVKKILKYDSEIRITTSMAKRVYEYINFKFDYFKPEEFDFEKLKKRTPPINENWDKPLEKIDSEINYNYPKVLQPNQKYKIIIDNKSIAGTILNEYKHHYTFLDENNHVSTILKNDLCLITTKIIRG